MNTRAKKGFDIDRVLQFRRNRELKSADPFDNFWEYLKELEKAIKWLADHPESEFTAIIERSLVIGAVSQIEVYFKDVLDAIFRMCKPDFYTPQLPFIYEKNHGVTDMLEIYVKSIHPCELVCAYQSFQNTAQINKVFSRFLGKDLWSTVVGMKVRVSEDPTTEVEYGSERLNDLEFLFELRHELVHYPPLSRLNEGSLIRVLNGTCLLFPCHLVLMNMIHENLDPAIAESKDTLKKSEIIGKRGSPQRASPPESPAPD